MFDTIRTSRIATLQGGMPPDGTLPLQEYLEGLLPDIAPVWAEQGLTGLQVCDLSANAATPQLCAMYQGEKAYICMPLQVTAPLDIQAMPLQPASFCASGPANARVFYACLLGVDKRDSWELEISNCVLVRENGQWVDSLECQQFLPWPVRTRWGRHSEVLGSAELAKLAVIMAYMMDHLEPFDLFVPGLYGEDALEQAPYRWYTAEGFGTCLLLVAWNGEGSGSVCALHFCIAGGGTATLVVRESPPAEGEPGLLPAKLCSGSEIAVSCPQVATAPHMFAPSIALLGHLNLYADTFESGAVEFTVDEGPLYEDACNNYRKENGCEPPEDFCLSFSTAGMRAVSGDDDGTAEVNGVVQEVSPCRHGCLNLTRYTVLCCPDDEKTVVNVYVLDEVKGDFDPQPGDSVHCTGSLHFLALERVELDAEQEAGMEERERFDLAQSVYSDLLPYGTAHALVARSIVHWGWELFEPGCKTYGGHVPSLFARRPDGVLVAFYVDCVINGEPSLLVHADDAIAAHKEHFREQGGEDAEFCHVVIHLDMNPKTGYYSVDGSISPEGVAPALSMPVKMKPYSLETLGETGRIGEAEAAAAFCRACTSGDWEPFVRWLPDDLRYQDLGTCLQFSYKEDAMRYICMECANRPAGAKYVPGTIAVSEKEGSVPCCVVIYGKKILACYGFVCDAGMVNMLLVYPPRLYPKIKPVSPKA